MIKQNNIISDNKNKNEVVNNTKPLQTNLSNNEDGDNEEEENQKSSSEEDMIDNIDEI